MEPYLVAIAAFQPLLGRVPHRSTVTAVIRMVVCVRVGLPEDDHLVTAKNGRFVAANADRHD